MDKYIKWFEANWKNIGLVVTIGAIGYLLLQPKVNLHQVKHIDKKALTTKLVKSAGCNVAQTEQIIQLASLPTLQDMLPSDSVVYDMKTFQLLKKEQKGRKMYKYYRRYGAKDVYITVATPITTPKEFIRVKSN